MNRNSLSTQTTDSVNNMNIIDPITPSTSSSMLAAAVNTNSAVSTESQKRSSESYISLSIVKDLIPQFDGKSSSLTEFIRECQMLNARVKPEDRACLLFLIRSKIMGHAKLVLLNHREPETLDELFSLLKKAYVRLFNMHHINEEFMGLKQGNNESIEIFGVRVGKILNTGSEIARDTYNSEQLSGVIDLLNNTAIASFINGLQDKMIKIMLRDKGSHEILNLETAIDIARRLEPESIEKSRSFLTSEPLIRITNASKINSQENQNFHSNSNCFQIQKTNASINNSEIYKENFNKRCFNCNKLGHMIANCPVTRISEPIRSKREMFRCKYCGKNGHLESRCYKKVAENTWKKSRLSGSTTSQRQPLNLNSMGAPPTGAKRSKPLIARA